VPLWVIAGTEASSAAEKLLLADGVVVQRAAECGNGLELTAVLKLLAERGITRLMVEGGPTLAGALVAADLVDEAVLFHSSKIVGADGIDALNGLPLAALTQSSRLGRVTTEPVGADRCDVFGRR
jgi:diaminohydroxyphosphoribosylaminopyrimidine deaminase/5-amino-6-(5-phosphoribosylamino)uracil reductase